mmetsp:Transcript_40888/g.95535  ORF Transcript_40888/g.95535 Transcript_40888/m.95535 type:complete len:238 (-) Transcript_40888:53-766(-)
MLGHQLRQVTQLAVQIREILDNGCLLVGLPQHEHRQLLVKAVPGQLHLSGSLHLADDKAEPMLERHGVETGIDEFLVGEQESSGHCLVSVQEGVNILRSWMHVCYKVVQRPNSKVHDLRGAAPVAVEHGFTTHTRREEKVPRVLSFRPLLTRLCVLFLIAVHGSEHDNPIQLLGSLLVVRGCNAAVSTAVQVKVDHDRPSRLMIHGVQPIGVEVVDHTIFCGIEWLLRALCMHSNGA